MKERRTQITIETFELPRPGQPRLAQPARQAGSPPIPKGGAMCRVLSLTIVLIVGAPPVGHAQTRHLKSLRVTAAECAGSALFLCSPAVTRAIVRAFVLSGGGTTNVEFGFGVIENAYGGFETTPVTQGEAGAWQATLPSSTIAIFHTHRNEVSPRPSHPDKELGDRLQMPIYVISRLGLWVYEPDPGKKQKGRSYQPLVFDPETGGDLSGFDTAD